MTTQTFDMLLKLLTALGLLIGPILLAIYQRQISQEAEQRDKAIVVELALIKAALERQEKRN